MSTSAETSATKTPSAPQPVREPLRVTLKRTVTIAVVAGAVLAIFTGGLRRWPVATLPMLWPSLGGDYVDLFYLNGLRPRLPQDRPTQTIARIVVWFIGGIVLTLGFTLT